MSKMNGTILKCMAPWKKNACEKIVGGRKDEQDGSNQQGWSRNVYILCVSTRCAALPNLWRCWHHHRRPKPSPQKLGPLARCTNTASKWCIMRPADQMRTHQPIVGGLCPGVVSTYAVWPHDLLLCCSFACWMSLAAILRAIPVHRRFSSPIFLFLLQRTIAEPTAMEDLLRSEEGLDLHGPKSNFCFWWMWKIPWQG